MSPWPWLLVLLLLVGQESSGEITEAIAVVKVVVWIDKLRGKHVTVATWRRCHGYGVVCKHVVVHGVFVEVTGCVVEEHVGYMGL